jgi:predicted metal-binding membrane protein
LTALTSSARRAGWALRRLPPAWIAAVTSYAVLMSGVPPARTHHEQQGPFLGMLLWLFMAAAMMLPLQHPALSFVWFRSYSHRRRRAVGVFVCSYLGVWGVVGVPVALLQPSSAATSRVAAVLAFSLAGIWALCPTRTRALAACHATRPLSPLGVRADLDVAKYGLRVGAACAATCWPLMAGCAFVHHGLAFMGLGALVTGVERTSFKPSARGFAIGAGLLSTLAAVS